MRETFKPVNRVDVVHSEISLEAVRKISAGHAERIFALLMFIIGFAMSAGPIIWILCSEIYPNSGRGPRRHLQHVTNWFVNAIVGQTFLTLLNTLGNGNTFLLYGD